MSEQRQKQPAHVTGFILIAVFCVGVALFLWAMPTDNPDFVLWGQIFLGFTALFSLAAAIYGWVRPVEHGTDVEVSGDH
ncbi:hypothetical protein DEU33_0763 [Kocuria sp. AG109]|uniref:hypothetical protein n=1 Tax=Rothia kristinae TaxID=37923 RepID=UPI000774D530|nr:hypothetical protein [Rothia kristinae]MBG7587425.1 hypothetical protein [Rothia kristinae]TDP57175.1 hypothetical protein DEU33_0763 [Kocuria sp. AG109]SIN04289.1 Uncharacterised protein [Mycobacteroides abscessus subsp. abscessus]SQC37046.1 Uncharacterised protein [Rothia kristinae]